MPRTDSSRPGRADHTAPARHQAGVNAPDSAHQRRVRSQDLLGPGDELWIEHNRKDYRLRVTAQGKLILTA